MVRIYPLSKKHLLTQCILSLSIKVNCIFLTTLPMQGKDIENAIFITFIQKINYIINFIILFNNFISNIDLSLC